MGGSGVGEGAGEAAGGVDEDFDGRVQDDVESEESPHASGGDNSARARDIYENL